MSFRLSTEEVLKINNKINTFVIFNAGSLDTKDVDLFVVIPPPAARDPSHQAAIRSMTHLCNTCRSALGYLSYYVETRASGGSEAVQGIPSACLLHDGHDGADTLQQGEDESCHLCVLLMSDLRTKRINLDSLGQSRIEMCWQADDEALSRLHFALTHGGHPRATDNYWNFLKLQLWPCSEHGADLFTGAGSGSGGGLERSSSTESQQTRDLAVEWLSVCQANEDGRHGQCNQGQGDWLPTRLLDVTYARETEELRLVLPHEHPEEFVSSKQYMTLSHCWGTWGPVTLPVLTVENLSERQDVGLDISSLPKTFKEALEVADWFKCRWLWIDSLCIIQDSTEDWQREAGMMYNVYKSALLNISADDSNDARWGCFRAREPLAVLPMRLRLAPAQEGEDGGSSPDQGHWLTPDSTGLFEAITKAPLARRAWVFQERQLSRRVLHFTSREVVWECCASGTYFACETFPRGGAPLPVLFGGRPKYQGQGLSGGGGAEGKEVYDTWDMLCQSYSEKKLSHSGDKAVALSGLAREFQALLPGDVYVAGMWKSLLPQSLLWKSADSSGRVDYEGYIAPSWSWLSIDGPISDFPPRGTSLPVMEVLGVTADPLVPSEPTASLRGACLDLRCYLRPVEIKPDYEAKPWYMMAVGGGKDNKLVVGDGGLEVGSFDPPGDNDTFTYSFDMPFTGGSGPDSVSAYFLPVSINGADETSSTKLNGLLVEPVGSDLTTFKRVGIMSCHGTHCLPILYKARDVDGETEENAGSKGQWNNLRSLLGERYDSRERIKGRSRRQKGAENSPSAPPGDISPLEGDQQPGITEAETENDGDQPPPSADAEVDKVREGMEDLHVSAGDKTLKPPLPTINWEAFETLERLYALDGAFIGSELEQHFSRMVARQIRLI
ncbi:hypothetical protein LA080_015352 [Diaporthe eres]|nr:hypothetical protein LA080_015352 [Diaporthe eres]